MIAGYDLWFWLTCLLGGLAFLASFWQFLRGRAPNDISQGSAIVLQTWLFIYFIGSIVMQILTDGPSGDWLEYYGYLLTAMVIPAGAVTWSLSEKSRWGTLILALVGPVLIVMVQRMNVIWYYYN